MVQQTAKGVSSAARRGVGGAAGDALKRTGSAARGATSAVSAATGMDAVEGIGEQVQQGAGSVAGAVESAGGGGDLRTVREELREIVRETALDVLVPVARAATMQAAKYAITRGPQLARDTVAPKLADTLGAAIEEAGGLEGFAKGWLASVSGARADMLQKVGIGGESQSRPWRERRLPLEESIDIVVPVETAYERFGEFEEYARVMSRGEMVDERLNERIAWERTDGAEASAVITFHRLSDRLTRVMVTYDQDPQGLLERTASMFRASRRRLAADLMRFKAFVEMTEEDTETPDEDPQQRTAEPRAHSRAQPRRNGHETAEGEESEGEDGGDEKLSRPAPSRPVRRRSAARSRQPKARRG
jgi:hypothetical protein